MIHKLGLVFNLIGSILLGLYIVGKDRLEIWENKVKSLPRSIPDNILSFILYNISKIVFKWNVVFRRKATEKAIVDIKNHAEREDLVEKSREWPTKNDSPVLYRFTKSILLGTIMSILLWIPFLPLILPLFIVTKFVSVVQDKLKIESFFGILGVAFLIIGFILQIIS